MRLDSGTSPWGGASDPALSYCGCGPVLLQTPVAIWDITKVWIRLESNVSYLNFTLYSMWLCMLSTTTEQHFITSCSGVKSLRSHWKSSQMWNLYCQMSNCYSNLRGSFSLSNYDSTNFFYGSSACKSNILYRNWISCIQRMMSTAHHQEISTSRSVHWETAKQLHQRYRIYRI